MATLELRDLSRVVVGTAQKGGRPHTTGVSQLSFRPLTCRPDGPRTDGLIIATRPLARLLERPSVVQTCDRLTGGMFVAFGVGLALQSRLV